MSEPFLGMIILVPYNFAPRGYAFCAGQIMSISQNTALFSLIGTTFGGNGQTTFALPDLRSRLPIGAGQGPGLSNYDVGQAGGAESVTLTANQMPLHSHNQSHDHSYQIPVDSTGSSARGPSGAVLGQANIYSNNPPDVTLVAASTATVSTPTLAAGGSQPTEILQPYLGLNYCIALEGIFPSRN